MPYARTVFLIIFCVTSSLVVLGAGPQRSGVAAQPNSTPRELVREVVENGLVTKDRDQTHWCYREVIRKAANLETREVCQSNAGTIDRLIALNNRPLSPEQPQRENIRIRTLLPQHAEPRKQREKQCANAPPQSSM